MKTTLTLVQNLPMRVPEVHIRVQKTEQFEAGCVIFTKHLSLKSLGTRQLKIQELSAVEVNNITTSNFFPFLFFKLISRALFNV